MKRLCAPMARRPMPTRFSKGCWRTATRPTIGPRFVKSRPNRQPLTGLKSLVPEAIIHAVECRRTGIALRAGILTTSMAHFRHSASVSYRKNGGGHLAGRSIRFGGQSHATGRNRHGGTMMRMGFRPLLRRGGVRETRKSRRPVRRLSATDPVVRYMSGIAGLEVSEAMDGTRFIPLSHLSTAGSGT